MTNIDELYSELFTKVMEDDMPSQLYYLDMVATQRHIPVEYLLQIGAMFIPNNEYIEHYLGRSVHASSAGFYYEGRCPWTLFVIIPVRNLAGEVVGIVGWDAYNKYKELVDGEKGLVSYRVSAKSVFPREKYFLCDVDRLQRTFDSRVVFVTDGVFDTVSLNYRGIPSIALLGSSFSREILYFLSWYKYIYVCADNDAAGLALVKKLSRSTRNVHRIIQNKTKDIEELLRTDGTNGPLTTQLLGLLSNPVNGDVMLGR